MHKTSLAVLFIIAGSACLIGCHMGVETECTETCVGDVCTETCNEKVGVGADWNISVNSHPGHGGSPATGPIDTDGDGLPDQVEADYGTSPTLWDTDGDGLSDGDELDIGCDPTEWDTDGDGLDDGAEILVGTSPLAPDSDLDGFTDGDEVTWGSDPVDPDTDDDGDLDGDEIVCGSSPLDPNLTCSTGTGATVERDDERDEDDCET